MVTERRASAEALPPAAKSRITGEQQLEVFVDRLTAVALYAFWILACIANHVAVPNLQPEGCLRMKPGIHACYDGRLARRRHWLCGVFWRDLGGELGIAGEEVVEVAHDVGMMRGASDVYVKGKEINSSLKNEGSPGRWFAGTSASTKAQVCQRASAPVCGSQGCSGEIFPEIFRALPAPQWPPNFHTNVCVSSSDAKTQVHDYLRIQAISMVFCAS
jgi:hypothetical protein